MFSCACIMMAIGGFLGAFGMVGTTQELLPAIVEAESGNLWESNREYLQYWKKELYSQLTEDEKKELYQKLIRLECIYWDIEPVSLEFEKYDYELRKGYYSHLDQLISVSVDIVEDSRETAMDTLLHEIHHAHAHDLVDSTATASSEEACLYKEGFAHYVSGENESNFDAYYENPVEVAARAYAKEWTENYFLYIDNEL